MKNQQAKNRLLIVMIFAMSIVPVLLAFFLNANPSKWLDNGFNNGHLIVPPIATSGSEYTGFDKFSSDNLHELKRHWLIANIIPKSECNEICLEAILKTRQLRLMLSKDLSRTRRVVLLLEGMNDNDAIQLWLKDSLLWRLRRSQNGQDEMLYQRMLQPDNKLDEYLINRLLEGEDLQFALNSDLLRIRPSMELLEKINGQMQNGLADGMLLLIDPLGNVIMWYEPGFDPYKVKSDLLHLLKVSQIG